MLRIRMQIKNLKLRHLLGKKLMLTARMLLMLLMYLYQTPHLEKLGVVHLMKNLKTNLNLMRLIHANCF